MTPKKISLEGQEAFCQEGETVLEALLRENIDIPYSCQAGACQSCLVRSVEVTPPASSQRGLREGLRRQKYFLACLCYPEQDMVITRSKLPDYFTEGMVTGKQLLNPETLLLTIECKDPLDFYAGQFVQLKRSDGLTRSYSIANSRMHATHLTFHIRRLAGGKFSEWVHRELQVGDTIQVSDPQGLCYYLPERQEQGLLLIGTGS